MKPGDAVWVYDDLLGIREGVCKKAVVRGGHILVTQISYGFFDGSESVDWRILTLNRDCFPTREALCEHYRKIFE